MHLIHFKTLRSGVERHLPFGSSKKKNKQPKDKEKRAITINIKECEEEEDYNMA